MATAVKSAPAQIGSLLVARFVLLGAIAGACLFLMTACHTVEGAGKDIESAGEGIQDAAD